MIVKIVLLIIIALLLVLDYALMVVSHEADERAERMYRKWKEEINERSNSKTDS